MSNQFLKLRRSAVQGKIPETSSLDLGELAINTYDGQLFLKKSGSQGEIVTVVGSTGSFTGSFFGNGSGLTSIPASGIVGLNLSQIATGSISASVNTDISASFRITSGSNTLLNVTRDGQLWVGKGNFVNQGYQLDVYGESKFNVGPNAVMIKAMGSRPSTAIGLYGGSAPIGIELPSVIGSQYATGYLIADAAYYVPIGILAWNGVGVGIKNNVNASDVTGSLSSIFTVSSITQGILTPRMTSVQRIAISNPAQGLQVFDTGSSTEGIWYYQSGSIRGWTRVLNNSGSQSISGSFTSSADALINSITIGRGNSNIASNVVVGETSGTSFTTGNANVAIGYRVLTSVTAQVNNIGIGYDALRFASASRNIGIGFESGYSMTGNDNVGIGYQTLKTTLGFYNVAVGTIALRANTSGSSNVAIGAEALLSNTTGSNNTAIGTQAMQSNTGNSNVAVGYQTMYSSTTAQRNIVVGTTSGFDVSSADNNVFVGHNTGRGITTGRANTILGSVQGLSSALSNNIILADGDGNVRYQWDTTRNNFFGNTGVSGSLFVSSSITASNALITSTLTAQTLVVQTITSSIVYSSGSNIFGNRLTDTQQFTGSVLITGSSVSLTGGSFSGSGANLYGIPASGITGLNLSQIATASISASVNTDISASFRITSASNTLLNVTKDGQFWVGNGSFVNAGYQADVQGTARVFGRLMIGGVRSFDNRLAIVTNGNTGDYSLGLYNSNENLVKYWLSYFGNDGLSILGTGGSSGLVSNMTFIVNTNSNSASFDGITIKDNASNLTSSAALNFFSQARGFDARYTARISSTNNTVNPYDIAYPDLRFWTGNTGGSPVLVEAMRIDSNQALLIGTTGSISSSILTLGSTTRGFLQPRMTSAERIAISNPAQGLQVFDTGSSTEGLWYYQSGSIRGWTRVLNDTGSESISGSLSINGSLSVNNTQFNSTSSLVNAGISTISQLSTGSYTSCFYNYTVASASNARSGQVMTVWNGSNIRYTEVVTTDIGDTSLVLVSASLSSGFVRLQVSASTSGWTFKNISNLL